MYGQPGKRNKFSQRHTLTSRLVAVAHEYIGLSAFNTFEITYGFRICVYLQYVYFRVWTRGPKEPCMAGSPKERVNFGEHFLTRC